VSALVERVLDFGSVKNYLDNIDENAYSLLNVWKQHSDINNDEVLAKEYGTKVTIVRSILNKLCYRGIVAYDKVKDKNSGWYNYYWKIDFEKIAKLIYSQHKDNKEKLENKVDLTTTYDLFTCNNECKKIPFEVAMEYNFVCPHCSEKLEQFDNKQELKETKKYLDQINTEMDFIKKILKKK